MKRSSETWIVVGEGQPELETRCLVCYEFIHGGKPQIGIGFRTSREWHIEFFLNEYIVSHWMPLPDLPEVE